ncbi:MAG: abscisic acid-deficient protein Aba4 family protein [Pseudomonadota bacterium]
MSLDLLFHLSLLVALIGWAALAAAPLAPARLISFGGLAVPALLSLAYAILALLHFPGGLTSLPDALLFFASPGALLAGWVYYLAFDLFVGGWQVRDARRRGLRHLAVLPCLLLTLMLGPIGLLAYLALRQIRTRPA